MEIDDVNCRHSRSKEAAVYPHYPSIHPMKRGFLPPPENGPQIARQEGYIPTAAKHKEKSRDRRSVDQST